jgi:hypothetical protein
VIQLAGITRNVGIERVSARRRAEDADRVDLLLKLTNGGDAQETRELVIDAMGREVARFSRRLEPGTSTWVTATVPASDSVLARLQPNDSLAEDDQLELDLAPLQRRRVIVDPACPPALVAAVATPLLLVRSERMPAKLARAAMPRGALQWSSAVPASSRPLLEAERLPSTAQLRAGPADSVLLAVGDEPLIVSRAGARRLIETSLDFSSPALQGVPEIPLLANLLFELLLDGNGPGSHVARPTGRLLDRIVVADRGPTASLVVPLKPGAAAMDAGTRQQVPSSAHVMADQVQPLVMAALLLLLWEIGALIRQWARLRPDFRGRSARHRADTTVRTG